MILQDVTINEKDTKNIYRNTTVTTSLASCYAINSLQIRVSYLIFAVMMPSLLVSDAVRYVLTPSRYKTSEPSRVNFALILGLQMQATMSGLHLNRFATWSFFFVSLSKIDINASVYIFFIPST